MRYVVEHLFITTKPRPEPRFNNPTTFRLQRAASAETNASARRIAGATAVCARVWDATGRRASAEPGASVPRAAVRVRARLPPKERQNAKHAVREGGREGGRAGGTSDLICYCRGRAGRDDLVFKNLLKFFFNVAIFTNVVCMYCVTLCVHVHAFNFIYLFNFFLPISSQRTAGAEAPVLARRIVGATAASARAKAATGLHACAATGASVPRDAALQTSDWRIINCRGIQLCMHVGTAGPTFTFLTSALSNC